MRVHLRSQPYKEPKLPFFPFPVSSSLPPTPIHRPGSFSAVAQCLRISELSGFAAVSKDMTSSGLIGPLFVRRYPDMPSAADVVNTLDQQALACILLAYGEERRAGRIAAAVVEARRAAPITGTRQLADVVAGRFASRDRRQSLGACRKNFFFFFLVPTASSARPPAAARGASLPHLTLTTSEGARAAGNRTLFMSSSHASLSSSLSSPVGTPLHTFKNTHTHTRTGKHWCTGDHKPGIIPGCRRQSIQLFMYLFIYCLW